MRRLNIVEIENSFLNFFTPAVIIAAAQFLYNILAWTLVLISSELFFNDTTIVIFGSIALILSHLFLVLIVWVIFLPRLRIQDVRSQSFQLKSLVIVFVAFCLSLLVFSILALLFDIFDLAWSFQYPWPFSYYFYFLMINPVILIFFILLVLLIFPLFDEVLYRRTIIPLLEDRGCPPILAVILTCIGHGMTFLPSFVLYPSFFSQNMFEILNFTLYSFFSGLIYIFTRRILYSYIFAVGYSSYQAFIALNFRLLDIDLEFLFTLGQILLFIASIGIIVILLGDLIRRESASRWIRIIKEPSESKTKKGIGGYLSIICVLIASQALFVKIGRIVTNNNPEVTNVHTYYPFIIWFYLIAFTIPFFLTITTEYARS